MKLQTHPGGWSDGFRHVVSHLAVTLLAITIAFSLPEAARYVLYQWWPKVENNTVLLLVTEISLAVVLVILLNGAKVARDNRNRLASARSACLVHARESNTWLARWKQRRFMRRFPRSRDAFVLTLTGFDTLVDPESPFREVLESAYEIRVMLMHPYGRAIERRAATLPAAVTLDSFREEIAASIERLAVLYRTGKKLSLKFYDQEPFWKLIVLSDHVWVQYCHSGLEVKQQPEYLFGLQHYNPRQGFFVPFYMHFMEVWNQPGHPQYDFDTGELVYGDTTGNETRRAPLGPRACEDDAGSGHGRGERHSEELPA